jgi:hypothetical protein
MIRWQSRQTMWRPLGDFVTRDELQEGHFVCFIKSAQHECNMEIKNRNSHPGRNGFLIIRRNLEAHSQENCIFPALNLIGWYSPGSTKGRELRFRIDASRRFPRGLR